MFFIILEKVLKLKFLWQNCTSINVLLVKLSSVFVEYFLIKFLNVTFVTSNYLQSWLSLTINIYENGAILLHFDYLAPDFGCGRIKNDFYSEIFL